MSSRSLTFIATSLNAEHFPATEFFAGEYGNVVSSCQSDGNRENAAWEASIVAHPAQKRNVQIRIQKFLKEGVDLPAVISLARARRGIET